MRRIRQRAEATGISVGWSAGALGAFFIVLSICWGLPDPWRLISFGYFGPLIPVVQTCQKVNDAANNPEGHNSDCNTANVVTIVIGGLLLALAVVETVRPK